MKNNILILSAIVALTTLSCSSTSKMQRAEVNAIRGEMILTHLENRNYLVKAEKINTRRGRQLDLRETNNYIRVNGDVARINLAYLGRSYDLRGISGINMTGQITESSLVQKKNGNTLVTLKVLHNNDAFKLNIMISNSGRCFIDIYNPKIDPVSYRGYFAALR